MPKSTIPIIYSDRFLDHLTGSFHPEKPGRLTAIVSALKNSDLADRIEWRLPTPFQDRNILAEVQRFHTSEYIAKVKQLSDNGGGQIDGDTITSAQTYEVALLAVSAWLDGVDRVLSSGQPTFVLARPPGHHACASTGMGFCIFNNASIAALYSIEQPGIKRVAILDWDVHHGNGTQAAAWHHHQIAYISTHQSPFYPGTGWQDETGAYGNILNIPMRSNGNIDAYLAAFQQDILPYLNQFDPDLLIVSAGFDANSEDPLASMLLKPQDYGVLTEFCLGLQGKLNRKVLFGLEGGYDFQSLSESVLAVVRQCLS